MNAACTIRPAEGQRAGEVVQEHLRFWQPVIAEVVKAILAECQESKRPIIFAWWGSESLKTKKVLDKTAFCKFPSVKIRHIEHTNPAAMADAFCDDPNIFAGINKAIKELGLGDPIEWLPDSSWKAALGSSSQAEEMGAFMQETQELHKMYLERLKDGLDTRSDDLEAWKIGSYPSMVLWVSCPNHWWICRMPASHWRSPKPAKPRENLLQR